MLKLLPQKRENGFHWSLLFLPPSWSWLVSHETFCRPMTSTLIHCHPSSWSLFSRHDYCFTCIFSIFTTGMQRKRAIRQKCSFPRDLSRSESVINLWVWPILVLLVLLSPQVLPVLQFLFSQSFLASVSSFAFFSFSSVSLPLIATSRQLQMSIASSSLLWCVFVLLSLSLSSQRMTGTWTVTRMFREKIAFSLSNEYRQSYSVWFSIPDMKTRESFCNHHDRQKGTVRWRGMTVL